MDYRILRSKMIETQLINKGIKDKLVLDAMSKVDRHLFVEEALANRAYGDYPLPIGNNQTISQPFMVAFMTQALHLSSGDRVLELGTGSGYQTAVLASICQKVYSIERISDLARKARDRLDKLGYYNVQIMTGDGTYGWKEKAPFNGILVTAGSPIIPQDLVDQLAEWGHLVIPVGDVSLQRLKIIKRVEGNIEETETIGCMFVKLIGDNAWHE